MIKKLIWQRALVMIYLRFFNQIAVLLCAISFSLLPTKTLAQSTGGMEVFKSFGPTLSSLNPPISNTTLFPTTISCTNGPVISTNLSAQGQNGNSFVSVDNLPLNSLCTIAEDMTQFPSLPAGCTWNTPQISPSPSILITGSQHFPQVVNDVTCNPVSGNITIEKVMSASTDIQPPAGTTFDMNVSCSNPNQTYSGQQGLGTSTVSVMAANSNICTVTEDVTQLPALPNGCTWDTPAYPNGNQTSIGAAPVQIVNSITCPPTVTTVPIQKTYFSVNPPNVPSNAVFNFVASCINPTQTYNISLPFNTQNGAFANVPIGSECTITEDTSTLPALLNGCIWEPPTYPSTLPVTASSPPGAPFFIANSMTCPPQLSTISITKRIDPSSMPNFPSGGSFNFNVQCTNPNQTYTGSIAISSGSSATTTVSNIPVGSNCTVTEDTTNLPPLQNGCTWEAPVYQNANTGLNVTTNGIGPVIITNSIDCPDASIDIAKLIDPSSDYIPPSNSVYNFNIACTGNQNFTTSITGQGGTGLTGSVAFTGISAPATCTVTEDTNTLPPLPNHCAWEPPTYPSNNPVSLTPGANPPFQVTNSVRCETGDLEVTKKFGEIPDAAGFSQSWSLPISAECSPGSGNIVTGTISTSGGAMTGLPLGPCEISEDVSLLPPLQNGCTWNPPQYSPTSQIVNIGVSGSTPTNMVISNSINCPAETGTISVEKVWGDLPKGYSVPQNFTFPISAECAVPGSLPFMIPATLTISGLFVGNIPLGAVCTVTEVTPMPVLPAGCYWAPPSYPNGNNVTVDDFIAGFDQTVVVKNSIICKQKPPFVVGDPLDGKKPPTEIEEPETPTNKRGIFRRKSD